MKHFLKFKLFNLIALLLHISYVHLKIKSYLKYIVIKLIHFHIRCPKCMLEITLDLKLIKKKKTIIPLNHI